METGKIFAQRIQTLRIQRGLKQREVGEAVGLTQKAISTMESGLRQTSFEKLVLLSKFFNVSTDYLLGLKDEP